MMWRPQSLYRPDTGTYAIAPVGLTPEDMTREQARSHVTAIVEHLEEARQLLYELYDRRGWLALGYSSWSAMITGEFARSRSFGSRQLAAAIMEQRNGLNIGTVPESWMRELRRVLPDEDDQDYVIQREIVDNGNSDAFTIEAAAKEYYVNHYGPAVLQQSMNRGSISIRNAYRLALIAEEHAGNPLLDMVLICTDPDLALALLELNPRSQTFEDITLSGCIPTPEGEQIPMADARLVDLERYLTYASREHRMQATEERREAVRDATVALVAACREYVTLHPDPSLDTFTGVVAPLLEVIDEHHKEV